MALSPKLILDISKNNQVENNLSFEIVKLIKEEQIEEQHVDQNIYNCLNQQSSGLSDRHDQDITSMDIPAGFKQTPKKNSRHDFLHKYDDSGKIPRYNDEQDYAFLPKNIEDFHSTIEEDMKYSCSSKISSSYYNFCQPDHNDILKDFSAMDSPVFVNNQVETKTTPAKIAKNRRKKLSNCGESRNSRKQQRKYLKETNFDEQRVMANVRER
jgi:hypothetical protein